MISNRVKRNLCLALAILSFAGCIDRAIRVFSGTMEWFHLATAVCLTVFWLIFWRRYRAAVKSGNLFGRVRLR